VGFFSLARGKSISCGGGGIIVTDSSDIAPVLEEEFRSLPMESSWSAMRNLAELAATGLLIHPRLYWLPSGLPFLGLGETRFYPDFPIRRMAEARAATLTGWRRRLAAAIAIRRERARQFLLDLDEAVHGVRAITAPEASYLRLPVLVRDRQAKRILCARGAESGLGISACYPTTVHLIPELQGLLPKRQYPGASEIVDRLVTLPTHVFVQPKDRRKIRELLEQVCGSRVGGDDGLRKPGQSSSPAHAVS
jgi:dTDP-4-amino-4,6-dideoxygalactose transaminase